MKTNIYETLNKVQPVAIHKWGNNSFLNTKTQIRGQWFAAEKNLQLSLSKQSSCLYKTSVSFPMYANEHE